MVNYFSNYTEDWSSGTIDPYRFPIAQGSTSTSGTVPPPSIVSGRLELRYLGVSGGANGALSWVESWDYVNANGPFYRLASPGDMLQFKADMSAAHNADLFASITDRTDYNHWLEIEIKGSSNSPTSANKLNMAWGTWDYDEADNESGGSDDITITYNPVAHAYLRVRLDSNRYAVFEGSPNGTTWTVLLQGNVPVHVEKGTLTFIPSNNGTGSTDARIYIDDIIVDCSGAPSAGPDYGNETDKFNPGAEMPLVPTATVSTILEQVRVFSGAVRRAVRLTGPKQITMVDPNASMGGGLMQADSDNMYHESTETLQAGLKVLTAKKGSLILSVGAGVLSDDVRMIESGWTIPARLPVYNIDPSPVKRVSMTFTPDKFSANVDFHVPDVPLHVRRT